MKTLLVPMAVVFAGLVCFTASHAQAQNGVDSGVDLKLKLNGTGYSQEIGEEPIWVRDRYWVTESEKFRANTKNLIELLGELSEQMTPFPSGSYLVLNTGSGHITVQYRGEILADVSQFIQLKLDDEASIESSRYDTMTSADKGKLAALVDLNIEDPVNDSFELELEGLGTGSFSTSAIKDGMQKEKISFKANLAGAGWDTHLEDDDQWSTYRSLFSGRISLSGSGMIPAEDNGQ